MKTRHMGLTILAASALGLAACNSSNDGGLAGPVGPEPVPPEVGVFGFNVGEPVAVISATRGQGASADFDQFTVTFNNAEGTSITIGTPEGEAITFDLDDPATWVGNAGSLPFAQLVSEDGDLLEVVLGEIAVPVAPKDPAVAFETEDQLVVAAARLDEQDTREGFETYMVVGDETDIADLPRYAEDVLDDADEIVHSAGDLIVGTAFYNGAWAGTIFQDGNLVDNTVTGPADVTLDFADASVGIRMSGTDTLNRNINLTGNGSGADIDFDSGVTYTGALTGVIGDHAMTGEFAGAVYGPGESAYDVLDTDVVYPTTTSEAVSATATAGVFEAASGSNLEIVGVFAAEGSSFKEPNIK